MRTETEQQARLKLRHAVESRPKHRPWKEVQALVEICKACPDGMWYNDVCHDGPASWCPAKLWSEWIKRLARGWCKCWKK